MKLEYELISNHKTITFILNGIVSERTTRMLTRKIEEYLTQELQALILNMQGVTCIDYSGMKFLVDIAELGQPKSIRFFLVGLHPRILTILCSLGIDSLFQICNDAKDICASSTAIDDVQPEISQISRRLRKFVRTVHVEIEENQFSFSSDDILVHKSKSNRSVELVEFFDNAIGNDANSTRAIFEEFYRYQEEEIRQRMERQYLKDVQILQQKEQQILELQQESQKLQQLVEETKAIATRNERLVKKLKAQLQQQKKEKITSVPVDINAKLYSNLLWQSHILCSDYKEFAGESAQQFSPDNVSRQLRHITEKIEKLETTIAHKTPDQKTDTLMYFFIANEQIRRTLSDLRKQRNQKYEALASILQKTYTPEWAGQSLQTMGQSSIDFSGNNQLIHAKLFAREQAQLDAKRKLLAQIFALPLPTDRTLGEFVFDPQERAPHSSVYLRSSHVIEQNFDTNTQKYCVCMEIDLQVVWLYFKAASTSSANFAVYLQKESEHQFRSENFGALS